MGDRIEGNEGKKAITLSRKMSNKSLQVRCDLTENGLVIDDLLSTGSQYEQEMMYDTDAAGGQPTVTNSLRRQRTY